jgi:hypothetical protein
MIPPRLIVVATEVASSFEGREHGNCLLASDTLATALRQLGFVASPYLGTFNGHPHAWVDLWFEGRLYWVDITAKQFGDFAKVIFVPAFSMSNYE